MATYKKRGYKKTIEIEEEVIVDDQSNQEESTTAEVFNTLEETANKSEKWVESNSKPLLIGLVAAVVVIFGYMGYTQFIVAPKEKEAADALVYAKQQFAKADEGADDALFTTALEGAEGKYGLVDIADNYGSTNAGNLAKYYAGLAYLKLKDYDKAIEFLKDVNSEDAIIIAIVAGSIGDAYLSKSNTTDALEYYTKASENSKNNAVAPLYLMKAGKLALTLKNYDTAQDAFTNIKENYPKSSQATNIDLYLNQAKYAN